MLSILDFTRTKIGVITDYKDLKIESSLDSGDSEISFTYLGSTPIRPEYYVQTDTARYTIKEADPDETETTYHGQLDLEDLQRTPFKKFTSTGQTLTAAASAALQGTGWTVSSSITSTRNVQRFKALPLDLLYAIRDAWMCEIRFDNLNKVVSFEDTFGEDKGVYFMRGLNLRRASPAIDSYDYVTRIIPYGADGLTIESVNDDVPYVENYQYSTKILTMIWEDTSYEDAATLKADAQKKLEDLSKPKTSYDCDVIDLANLSGQYDILDYSLGDTIHLIDDLTGVDDRQRIVKITEYPDEPERDACEISNTVLTFEEIQSRMDAAARAWDNVTNPDGSVNGVYVHGVEADGIVGIETVITENAAVQGAVSNVQVLYAQGDSPSEAPESGWDTTAPAWDSGKYVWQKTVTTYVSGDTDITQTNITGAKGDSGEDATVLRIDSSQGIVFKNDLFNTVLTVSIIRGGQTITKISDLRSAYGSGSYIQWYYKRPIDDDWREMLLSDSHISRDGFELEVTPTDVDEQILFQADLIVSGPPPDPSQLQPAEELSW